VLCRPLQLSLNLPSSPNSQESRRPARRSTDWALRGGLVPFWSALHWEGHFGAKDFDNRRGSALESCGPNGILCGCDAPSAASQPSVSFLGWQNRTLDAMTCPSRLAMLAVGAGLLTAACAPTTGQVAGSSVGGAPTYYVGDRWTFSNSLAVSVKSIDGNVLTFAGGYAGCFGCLYRGQGHRLETFAPDGGVLDVSRHAFVQSAGEWIWWDFPLHVGKHWQFSGVAYLRGRAHHLTVVSRVWAYEDVSTKAGTFRAFKVGREYTYLNPDARFTVNSIHWYAPSVKFLVKDEATFWNYELVDFSVK
jgi:hypothetical protein